VSRKKKKRRDSFRERLQKSSNEKEQRGVAAALGGGTRGKHHPGEAYEKGTGEKGREEKQATKGQADRRPYRRLADVPGKKKSRSSKLRQKGKKGTTQDKQKVGRRSPMTVSHGISIEKVRKEKGNVRLLSPISRAKGLGIMLCSPKRKESLHHDRKPGLRRSHRPGEEIKGKKGRSFASLEGKGTCASDCRDGRGGKKKKGVGGGSNLASHSGRRKGVPCELISFLRRERKKSREAVLPIRRGKRTKGGGTQIPARFESKKCPVVYLVEQGGGEDRVE